ncbi:MAG: hypothetical protein IK073_05595 [Paludibacteraceae bacterium]|nr:hypothetical protein [Paludibacteraceae bacterium]
MKRCFVICLGLLLVSATWALNETVEVSAGVSTVLPASVDASLQAAADAQGLVLLGWTIAEISDGYRPATYYGLGATVTPAVNTTYYAFFARPSVKGEIILRQTATPTDGDTLIAATLAGTSCWLPMNEVTSDMQLSSTFLSNYSGSQIIWANGLNGYLWVFEELSDGQFQLRSAKYSNRYLHVTTTVQCGDPGVGRAAMLIVSGFMYNVYSAKYLYAHSRAGGIFWETQTKLPTGQSFAFFRKERYADFCTSITPCPGCYLYTLRRTPYTIHHTPYTPNHASNS